MQRIRVSSASFRRADVWNPIAARGSLTVAATCSRANYSTCRGTSAAILKKVVSYSPLQSHLLPSIHLNRRSFHHASLICHGRHGHRDQESDRNRDDHHDHQHEHDHEHEHEDKHEHASSTPSTAATSTASSKPTSAQSSTKEEISTLSPEAIAGQVRDGFNKLRATLHQYTLGSKLLWKNYKRSREIRRLLPANGFPSSRTDYLLLQRADADFKLGVPFIFVFALPFVGYAAPIFAYFAPRYIPSTFHTGDQIKEFVMEDAKDARKTLVTGIEVYGFHSRACSLDRLRAFMRRVERGLGRVDDAREVEKLAPIFQQLTPRLNMYSKHHLSLFHRSLLHSSFIAEHLYIKKWLIADLERWREAILKDDQLIRVSGVESLRTLQLAQALYARGIYRHPNYMGQMLALDQSLQLASVESKSSPNYVSDEDREIKLKAGEPPEAIIADWRNVLYSWIEIHCKLNEEAVLRKNNVLLAPVPPPAAIPSVFATAAGIKDVNNTASRVVEKQLSLALAQFPTAFMLHLPLLLRLPNSATNPFIASRAKTNPTAAPSATVAPAASA